MIKPIFQACCLSLLCLGALVILPSKAQNQSDWPIAQKEIQRQVMEVYATHSDRLFGNPDVLGIIPSPGTGELWIITDRPNMVPREVESVPVVIKPPPPHLPPPPSGVIILKEGGGHEHRPDVAVCPPQYREARRYRWRFCNPVSNLQMIPAPMAPPIAGVPYKEAQAIYKRHLEELRNLPGVTGGGLGAAGITIRTTKPELVPGDVEGLPIKTAPPRDVRIGITKRKN